MATHFYQLRIINRRQETTDCISLAFEVPESLQSVFAFTQGQHLTLRATINGQEVRRNYSLCSSPLEGEWRIAIKRLEGGLFSQYAHQHLQPGQTIEVMPPSGRFFTPLHPDNQHHYVAFCAGSGITPVISIIKTTLSTEPNSQFTLVYANRRTSSIIFKEELEALKNVYMHRFRLVHILSAERGEVPLLEGRIDAAKTRALCTQLLVPQTVQAWFLCGPEGIIFSAKEGLLEAREPEVRIHFVLFT
ncbi:MAG TPA: FAD-binding oxidoreductase, partial [Phnomibacter sp.]|nr:FAD-binding oxidoreductase [Phnomibacter sp.]